MINPVVTELPSQLNFSFLLTAKQSSLPDTVYCKISDLYDEGQYGVEKPKLYYLFSRLLLEVFE